MRAIFQWNLGSRVLDLGRRTLIMGVVNVTPDSFSDGGAYLVPDKALAHAQQLLTEGADIIDIGGESTRPGAQVVSDQPSERAGVVSGHRAGALSEPSSGALEWFSDAATRFPTTAPLGAETKAPALQFDTPVSEEEELRRVIPVIRNLKLKTPQAIISIDTYKSAVARAAVEAGAEIVNDISGFRWDSKMAKTLAELKVGAVLMHTRGRPDEWRSLPPIGDPVLTVKRELRQHAEAAVLAGIKRDYLVLDPGFGFGKRFEENYPLLARFSDFQQIGFPLLAGTSRKSFVGRMLARDGKDAVVDDRLLGTLATETVLILKGAHIIRTHDARSTAAIARVADIIVASGG
jgi:dihydropteroate synthase